MFLKTVVAGAFLMLSVLVLSPGAQAANLSTGLQDAGGQSGAGYDTDMDITAAIGLVIRVLIGMLGIVFLLLTIYAGFTWMTAAGDTKKVDKAKGILTTAVIGLVIVLAAYSITSFVITQLEYVTDETTGAVQ